MNKILNFTSILGIIGICTKYCINGELSVTVAGVLIIVITILAAVNNWIIMILKAIISIVSFALLFMQMKDAFSIIQPILVMLIALFGIYIMFRKIFNSDNKDDNVHFTFNKKTGKLKKRWW